MYKIYDIRKEAYIGKKRYKNININDLINFNETLYNKVDLFKGDLMVSKLKKIKKEAIFKVVLIYGNTLFVEKMNYGKIQDRAFKDLELIEKQEREINNENS